MIGSYKGYKLDETAKYAFERSLRVFAGHGLTPQNVVAISSIPEIEELNIGHNIIARSVYLGMERAIGDIQSAIQRGIRLRKD